MDFHYRPIVSNKASGHQHHLAPFKVQIDTADMANAGHDYELTTGTGLTPPGHRRCR